MSVEQQKLKLIEQITALDDVYLLFRLAQLLAEQKPGPSSLAIRQPGFAKGVFPFIADDFDNTLPPGFEDYLLTVTPASQPQ